MGEGVLAIANSKNNKFKKSSAENRNTKLHIKSEWQFGTYGWLSKCWFLSSALLPHLHWGPHYKYLVGLPYLQFSEIQDKVNFVWQAQYRGLFFQSSVLSVPSLLSLLLTSSRLSRLCLGDSK